MAPGETENNPYAKFWSEQRRVLWYGMVFSGVVNYVLVPFVKLVVKMLIAMLCR